MRDLINITQLSQWLQLAKGTIYNLVYQRRIPFVKIGRALRFDPEKIKQVIREIPIQSEKAGGGRRS